MRIDADNAGVVSAAIYGGVSTIGALVFLIVTIATGDYSWVSRVGGAIWVFVLGMIILMPTVTPLVRARVETPQQTDSLGG